MDLEEEERDEDEGDDNEEDGEEHGRGEGTSSPCRRYSRVGDPGRRAVAVSIDCVHLNSQPT